MLWSEVSRGAGLSLGWAWQLGVEGRRKPRPVDRPLSPHLSRTPPLELALAQCEAETGHASLCTLDYRNITDHLEIVYEKDLQYVQRLRPAGAMRSTVQRPT